MCACQMHAYFNFLLMALAPWYGKDFDGLWCARLFPLSHVLYLQPGIQHAFSGTGLTTLFILFQDYT